MVPSGPPTPIGGTQSVAPSLLRQSSSMIGGAQAGSVPSQHPFPSLVSPRTQFNSTNNNINLLGNMAMANVPPLLNHSFGNAGAGGGGLSASHTSLQQRVDLLSNAEPDAPSFTSSSGPPQGQQNFQSAAGNQLGSDHSQPQQLNSVQNFQQQFALPHNQQQPQLQRGMGNVGSLGAVKLESQIASADQNGPSQQLQSLRNIGVVKVEPQQLQPIRNFGQVKMEPHHLDPSLFLQQQQQQQQQQLLQMSRHSSQSAAAAQLSMLQQRNLQQQQQQQILKNMPQQRSQLQQQLQQNIVTPQMKPAKYEPGMCAKRLTHYMYHQRHRPEDNNIEFWRKFVTKYFAPNAKKRWCASLYGSGRQTTGVFPQDVWHCEICNRKPGRGFETTVEVLPRLCQIKYASGTLEELLYVDSPYEYENASGQIVLDYNKAIQESVFEQLRVVREGHLRIVFSRDLKICSWEFCARRHEELIPRRLIIPQVSQLGGVVQKFQTAAQSGSSGSSNQDLQNACNSFVTSARQLAKALEVPLVNDLGYTKRYVRCLQISEVVNSMKDLIDYSKETGTGPMESLINFPRRTSGSGLNVQQARQSEQQQTMGQSSNHNDPSSTHCFSPLPASANNSVVSGNNSLNAAPSTSTSATTIARLLHQNSMNSRQENQLSNVNSPYVGGGANTVQIPSASSSNSLPPSQPNPSSPFPSPTLSTSNNNTIQTSHNASHMSLAKSPANLSTVQQPIAHEADATDSQSSVQQILQEVMMSSHLNGVGNLRNEMKGINGITPTMNGGTCLVGNGIANSAGLGTMGFGSVGGIGPSSTASGLRAMANNAMALNGRVAVSHISRDSAAMNHQQQQQQDIGNQLLGGYGAVNSFNNLQFDWKCSP